MEWTLEQLNQIPDRWLGFLLVRKIPSQNASAVDLWGKSADMLKNGGCKWQQMNITIFGIMFLLNRQTLTETDYCRLPMSLGK